MSEEPGSGCTRRSILYSRPIWDRRAICDRRTVLVSGTIGQVRTTKGSDAPFKLGLKFIQKEASNVSIGDQDISRRGEGGEDGLYNVWDEVESTVNRLFVEDGHLEDVRLGGRHMESKD